jgi:hypothetical protein
MARQQHAKSLGLRAAMSLTRLYQKRARQVEARPFLIECYGWFIEGSETADFQKANTLLKEVA